MPNNSSVLEGGEVVISCEVGNRVGAVQWVKDGFAYVIEPSEYTPLTVFSSFFRLLLRLSARERGICAPVSLLARESYLAPGISRPR